MTSFRSILSVLTVGALCACSGGDSTADVDDPGPLFNPNEPAIEITDPRYTNLSVRTTSYTAGAAYVVLNGQTVDIQDGVAISYSNGTVSGDLLDGTDLDSADFINPANGEFSRIVSIPGSNIFGAVGLDVLSSDLPASGTASIYNEGWVGMTASFDNDVLVLEGDAAFSTTWGTGDLDGRFFNLSGTNAQSENVTNVGDIILTDASVLNDNFSGGQVTGTGVFAPLGSDSSTAGTNGTFFGPQADELGGVLVVDDSVEDIQILGAFQAD